MPINIVMVNPQIPSNTGNVARTCAITGARLHLVKPLGFSISDKQVKRAGLDYWHMVDISVYEDFDDFIAQNPDAKLYFFTTKAKKRYSDVEYLDNDYIVFGSETKGLPEDLLDANYDMCLRIPMRTETRSLNLANSVNIALYEALRQLDFPDLSHEGELTTR